MLIELNCDQILEFKETQAENIEQIKAIESENAHFICPYSMDEHMFVLKSENEKHISIFEKEEELVGFIILKNIKNRHKNLEFRRIVISKKGLGYGHESLRWLKKYCFEDLKFHRLWFDVFTDNERGIHLYESEGFYREGILRESIWRDGKYRSLFLYSMLESEYFSTR